LKNILKALERIIKNSTFRSKVRGFENLLWGLLKSRRATTLSWLAKSGSKSKLKPKTKTPARKCQCGCMIPKKEHSAIGQFCTGQGFLCIVCGVIGWWGSVGLRKVE